MQNLLLLFLSMIALAGGFPGAWWVADKQRQDNAVGIFFGTLGLLIVGIAGLFGVVILAAQSLDPVELNQPAAATAPANPGT